MFFACKSQVMFKCSQCTCSCTEQRALRSHWCQIEGWGHVIQVTGISAWRTSISTEPKDQHRLQHFWAWVCAQFDLAFFYRAKHSRYVTKTKTKHTNSSSEVLDYYTNISIMKEYEKKKNPKIHWLHFQIIKVLDILLMQSLHRYS